MLFLGSNPEVGLVTRKWLVALSVQGQLLDQVTLELLLRVIDSCRSTSPCGTVCYLTRKLNPSSQLALVAGSISELFYAVCSYTDDLQDGDTDSYLSDVPTAIKLNIQAHLNCLVAVRGADLTCELKSNEGLEMIVDIFKTGAKMLNGQRKEIERKAWTIEQYEEVGRRIAGDQYGTQLRLAAVAAGVNPSSWAALGLAYGTLLQLVVDFESKDPRLFVFAPHEIARLQNKLSDELNWATTQMTSSKGIAQRLSNALFNRCTNISL